MANDVLINDMEHKDEEILALSLEQPSVFEALVDRYQNDFLRAAFKVVKSKEEAEDIVQESFTKIYLNAGKFRNVEGASFRSWAYKIVFNTSFNHYKKLKRTREVVKNVEADFYDNVADAKSNNFEIDADMKACVNNVLPQLPLHLQGVLKKYYLEDKSQKQIAEEEGISMASIKMRLFRAKRLFKKVVEQDLSGKAGQNLLCTAMI
jgi:RNA polymerase sigma factor (sigma-70 family)